MVRQGALWLGAALALWGCGKSVGGKVQADRSALLFGLDTGEGVRLGTQPINTLQLTNTGDAAVTLSGTSVVKGQPFSTTPVGGGGSLAASLDHPDFFTASPASQGTLQPNETAVVQVIFNPQATGLYAAALKVSTSAGDVTVELAGDAVTPLLQVGSGTLSTLELPPVALKRKSTDLPDGGPAYVTGLSVGRVQLFNVGSADLSFQPAELVGDGGAGDPISLCEPNPVPGVSCDPGPLPQHLSRPYPDGGPVLHLLPDGGTAAEVGVLSVYFTPAVPGEYTQVVQVQSDATNTPSVTLQIHGLATPDGG